MPLAFSFNKTKGHNLIFLYTMKKVLLVVGLALATMGANAQLFVGGGLGFNTGSNKNGDGDKASQVTSFNFAPEVGFSITDKLDAGIDLSIGTTKTTTWTTPGDNNTDVVVKGLSWRIAPFAQYSFVEFGKFKLLGKASLYINGNKETRPTGLGTGTIDATSTSYGLTVAPYLHYVLNDSFNLFAGLNFLGLNVGGTTNKSDGNKTGSSFNAGLSVNTFNVANVGAITIGAVYKF
jgi:hypothetical protein